MYYKHWTSILIQYHRTEPCYHNTRLWMLVEMSMHFKHKGLTGMHWLQPCCISSLARNMDGNVTTNKFTSCPVIWTDGMTSAASRLSVGAASHLTTLWDRFEYQNVFEMWLDDISLRQWIAKSPKLANKNSPHYNSLSLDFHLVQGEFVRQRHVGYSAGSFRHLPCWVSSASFGWFATEWRQWPSHSAGNSVGQEKTRPLLMIG